MPMKDERESVGAICAIKQKLGLVSGAASDLDTGKSLVSWSASAAWVSGNTQKPVQKEMCPIAVGILAALCLAYSSGGLVQDRAQWPLLPHLAQTVRPKSLSLEKRLGGLVLGAVFLRGGGPGFLFLSVMALRPDLWPDRGSGGFW